MKNIQNGKVPVLKHTMKTYVGVKVKLHTFLTVALAGGDWSTSHSITITPLGKGHYTFQCTFSTMVLVYTRPVKLVYSSHSLVGGHNTPEECTTTIFTPLLRRWCLYISLKRWEPQNPGLLNIVVSM
jgi:hypothetical protein